MVRNVRISPNFVRLTLGGLDGLEARGADHWCRLFFTRQGQDVLTLPTSTSEVGWYLQYLATPKTRRPWVRAYTLRDARPDVGEVDIDFVIHGDENGSIGPQPGSPSTLGRATASASSTRVSASPPIIPTTGHC
ncbi:MAG TPA: siderophore-interacting protein [Aeromicrobium sp.]|nr:siderophore-interacting protein [Aeromicrobium sp.]